MFKLQGNIVEHRGYNQCFIITINRAHAQLPLTLRPYELQAARILCPWDTPGKNTGVGGLSLLQRIFPSQVSNWGLLHCIQILCHLSYKGSCSYQYSNRANVHTWVEPDISLRQNQLYFSSIHVWSYWKRKEPRMESLFWPEKPEAVTTMRVGTWRNRVEAENHGCGPC